MRSDHRTDAPFNPGDHRPDSAIQSEPIRRTFPDTVPGAQEHKEIDTRRRTESASGFDRQLLVHGLILLAVSIGFESLFIHHGLSAMDEGWPLHAAMEMLDGKTLYDEVFWVFPPGHLVPALLAYGLDPPGLVLVRTLYAAFTVALCLALLFVARRLMPADFALLGALLVAVAAPRSHFEHLLFGYRYLVWSIVVLLFFHLRLTRDESRWLFLAGIFAGVALFFRLTPAFAVSVAVGVGIIAASRNWRRWLRDGLWYSAGLVLVWIPILVWMQGTVGLEKFWIEMVIRPVEMTALQSKPIPPILLENLNRSTLSFAFAAIGFRFYPLLYLGFAVALLYRWGRALGRRRSFEDVFLLTFVVFGAIYFTRSMGRSDLPHLDSAIPPVAILLAYCTSLSTRFSLFRIEAGKRRAAISRAALCICVFGVWTFMNGSDRFLDREAMMGVSSLQHVGGTIKVRPRSLGMLVDRLVPVIQRHAKPDDTILVMTHAPLLYVLTDRHSPGYFDVVMPGTFRSREEEQGFLERIQNAPPAVVVWPRLPFDRNESRGLEQTAPLLSGWVADHYRSILDTALYRIMTRREPDWRRDDGSRLEPQRPTTAVVLRPRT